MSTHKISKCGANSYKDRKFDILKCLIFSVTTYKER